MRTAVVALAAAALALGACRSVPPDAGVVVAPDAPRVASALAALRDRSTRVHALRASGRLVVSSPDVSLDRPQRLVVERPDRLRFKILGLFDQVAALLVSDGREYAFVDLPGGRRERGPVDDGVLWRTTGIDLSPPELVALLLGTAPIDAAAFVVQARLYVDGHVQLHLRTPGATRVDVLEIEGDGALRMLQRGHVAGATMWEAHFADLRPVGLGDAPAAQPLRFAHRVEVAFPRIDASVGVEFGQVELNPALPEGVFVLHVAPGG